MLSWVLCRAGPGDWCLVPGDWWGHPPSTQLEEGGHSDSPSNALSSHCLLGPGELADPHRIMPRGAHASSLR